MHRPDDIAGFPDLFADLEDFLDAQWHGLKRNCLRAAICLLPAVVGLALLHHLAG